MPAGIYDWPSPQGSTNVHRIVLKENDADGVKVVKDLTGFTFNMQVRTKAGSATVVLEASSVLGNINIVGAATAGTIDVEFTKAQTSALAPRRYVYDLEYTDSAGSTDRILEGAFTVDAEVTR